MADLPRDLGFIKPFLGIPTRTGVFGGYDTLSNRFASSLNAWLRKPNIDGDTFEGLLPMYAFASSAGEATSFSLT